MSGPPPPDLESRRFDPPDGESTRTSVAWPWIRRALAGLAILGLVGAWLNGMVYRLLLFGPGVVVTVGLVHRLIGAIRHRLYFGLFNRPLSSESRPYLLQLGFRCGLSVLVVVAGWIAIPRSGFQPDERLAVFVVFLLVPALLFVGLQVVPTAPVSRSLNVVVLLLVCFLGFQPLRLQYLSGLDDASAVAIESPVAAVANGDWVVGSGGPSQLVNHHFVPFLNQHNAIDLLVVEDDLTYDGPADQLASYHCWGVDLLAPADATVTAAVGDLPDQAIGSSDPENLLGNHVMLDIGQGRFVMMAHLQQGSLSVAEGDQVSSGDRVGACGNSGNTTEPHLHIQIQDVAEFSFDTAIETFPIRIDGVVHVRGARESTTQTTHLRRDDIIRPAG